MIISRAPVRISFFGGGTDFPEYFEQHGGAVLATAVDKYSFVTASSFQSHLFDYAVRVSYSKGELVKCVDEIQHPVFRECLRQCCMERDVELHAVADLPAFTGLGSSSSFTVALLHALHAFKGEFIRPIDLAYEAIQVERRRLHDSVGCQDQVIAAVGGFNLIEFRTESDIVVNRLPISPNRLAEFERHLLLVFTGQKRRAGEIECKKIAKLTQNLGTLREMRSMVDHGYNILVGNQCFSEFGGLLHRAWEAKRTLLGGVSNPAIDDMYCRGLAAGAWGGKLLGAGGGGFLLFFAPPERHASICSAFAEESLLDVKINAPGSQIIFS